MYAIILITTNGITVPFVFVKKQSAEDQAKDLREILKTEALVKVVETRLEKD